MGTRWLARVGRRWCGQELSRKGPKSRRLSIFVSQGDLFASLNARDLRELAPLLRNTRKTECGASLFLTSLAVRAAPFALLSLDRDTAY